MSYQGFNWSPCFDHMPDHQRRNQPSEVNESSYQRHSYQPAAIHTPSVTNAPSQEYSSAQNSAESNSHSTRYAPGGESIRNMSQDYFDSRRLPPYSTAQTSINTTAMGNLVYASSLAQEQRTDTTQPRYDSMQHIVDYNRYSQPTTSSTISTVHGMTSAPSKGYEQRSDSRGSGIAKEEYRPSDSRTNYSTSNSNANTNANTSAGTHANTQLGNERYNQSRARPSSRNNSKISQFSSTSRQSDPVSTTHSKRLPSVKQTKTVPSRPISVSNPIDRGTLPSSVHNGSTVRRSSNQKQTAEAPLHVESSTSHHQVPSTSNNHGPQNRSATSKQTSYPPRSLSYQPQGVQPREHPARENLPYNRDEADSSRVTDAKYQTTVDPSHIFNQYEFQKRQTAAEASRKVAEETATKVDQSFHVAAPAPAPARVSTPAAAASAAGEDPAADRKNQMELEMMQMIEKMRDYKAKDPALFSQIWEQVKKGQPANHSQPANRSVSQASASASNNKENSIAEITETVPLLSPTPTSAEVPLEASVESKAPDLGKFPFHRRKSRKLTLAATDSNVRSTTFSTSISTESGGNNPITSEKTPLFAGNGLDNAHDNVSANVESANATMSAAMKNFSHNMTSQPQQGRFPPQIVHVRGVGPQFSQEPSPQEPIPEKPSPQESNPQEPSLQELGPQKDPSKKGTIWPQGNHKWALAEAARRALTSGSVNAGRAISVSEIVMILDQNPSYTELCEKLELRGFIIDRGHFARLLLAAVSGTAEVGIAEVGFGSGSSSSTNKPSQSQMKNNGFMRWQGQGIAHSMNGSVAATPAQQYSRFGMLMKTPAIRSHGLPSAAEVISRSSSRNLQMPFSREHVLALNTPPLVPSSKKEMAKKRTFAEVIDLTQHVSDDEIIIPENSVKSANERDGNKNSHLNLRSEVNSAPMTDEENMNFKGKHASLQRDLLHSETIIQPMNKRNALRRDNYNAKTIARDILVASGKHSLMVSLNYHIDILRKKFRHVDNNSDLTTFQWNLVDPGEPAKPGTPAKPIDDVINGADDEGRALDKVNSDGQPQIASAADGDDVVMIDVDSRQSITNFPSLDKFKAAGSGEGEMSFQRTPIAAIYHEIFTPSSRRRGRPPGSGKKRNERNEAIISSQPRSQTSFQSESQTPFQSESQTPFQSESQTPSQPTGPRRRGRPLGSKNRGPRKSAAQNHMGTSTGPQSSTGPLRQSGLKNTMTASDGFAIVIDSHHSDEKQEQDKKKTKPNRRNGVVHQVYKCRWNDCPYELHNLQTLRKHVYKHREQYGEEGPIPCCWAECGTINLSENDAENELIPLEFDVVSAWESHIDAKHLNILAWDKGDGPSSSDVEASDHLSDAQGRQMTPVARTTGPSGPLSLTSGKEVAQQYHKIRGNRTDRDKAKTAL